MSDKIKVLSANCQGLQNYKKRVDVINYMDNLGVDIICLQDTHWLNRDEMHIKSVWKGECLLNGRKSNSRGVAILLKKTFEYKIESSFCDTVGNLVSVDLLINKNIVKIINIYAPNQDSPDFFETIDEIISEDTFDHLLICGDFNLTLNPSLDSYNYRYINNPRSRTSVLQMMRTHSLIDTFRHFHSKVKRYTWRRTKPFQQARLDYFLVNTSFLDQIENSTILPGYRSDHSFLQINIIFTKFIRGKGVWKFNTSLLQNIDYVNTINNIIDLEKYFYAIPVYNLQYLKTIEDSEIQFTISDSLFLEVLLSKIRGETVKFSSGLKKTANDKERILMKDIETLENLPNSNNIKLINAKKDELEKLRELKMKGHIIRSRAHWLQEGEKPTSYFCNLERHTYVEKTVQKLVDSEGNTVIDQKEILEEIQNFYQKLFQNSDDCLSSIDPSDLIPEHLVNKLSPSESKELEGTLLMDELNKALKDMKNGKTPGIDGFPAEFFKFFWNKLKFFVLRALNNAYTHGEMSTSLRHCIITCLPKGNKAREYLKNWRPISLLSVVYKIGSTAIANRMKRYLGKLISESQSGFVSGRYIGDNTRLMYDLMHYTEINDIPGLLMLVDFQKAFDSVSWNFLYKTLKFFGFGPSLMTWIKIFNTNIKATVLQCGVMSKSINIEKGCRQGDPIASYLFLLCAQILLLLVESNIKIKGIYVGQKEYKISQFADDTTLILDGHQDSLQAAINTLELYGSLSGLKVNTDKTQLVWVGKKRGSKEKLNTNKIFNWDTQEFKLLGIHFSSNLANIPNLNYEKAIVEVESILKVWQKRLLTPFGKATILKTLVLPKFTHLFLSLPNPSGDFIKKFNSLIYNFIWNNKPEKISRNQLNMEYHQGGIKMIEINSFIKALKLTWIRKLYMTPESPWAHLTSFIVGSLDKIILFGPQWSETVAKRIDNPFWRDVLLSWKELLHLLPLNSTLHGSLWFTPISNNTTVSIYIPKLYQKGILSPLDLICNGKLMSQNEIQKSYNVKLNFLDYHRISILLNSYISRDMVVPSNLTKPYLHSNVKILMKSAKGSQDFRKLLTSNIKSHNSSHLQHWTNCLNFEFDQLTWQTINNLCFKTIKDNNLSWFQYRLIYRILGTQSYLYKVKISENSNCNLCSQYDETIQHLFVLCQKVQSFWNNIKIWLEKKLNLYFDTNPIKILFGDIFSYQKYHPINLIYMTAKHYIFHCSKSGKNLNIFEYQSLLYTKFAEQNYLSHIEMRHDQFKKKWSSFENLFT